MFLRPFAPLSNDDADLADWAEGSLFILDLEELSRPQIAQLLSGSPLEEEFLEPGDPEGEVEEEALEDLVADDSRVDQIFNEVIERTRIAERVYPFRTEADLLRFEPAWIGADAYLFLLWPCIPGTPFRMDGRYEDHETGFDLLTAAALKSLLGSGTEYVLFDQQYASDDDEAVRPTSFPEAIKWLRKLLRLAVTHTPPPTDPAEQDDSLPAGTYNDGGVDVIAWKEFGDQKAAFPIALAQTTIQGEWRKKTRDVIAELWNSWLVFPTPPQRVLAIPFVASHRSTWFARNLMAGLILDRMRLAELLSERPDEELVDVVSAEDREWLSLERAEFVILEDS